MKYLDIAQPLIRDKYKLEMEIKILESSCNDLYSALATLRELKEEKEDLVKVLTIQIKNCQIVDSVVTTGSIIE